MSYISADTSNVSPQVYSVAACNATCADCLQEYNCWPSFAGCMWSPSNMTCNPDPCRLIQNNNTCENTTGCFWDSQFSNTCKIDMGGPDCAQFNGNQAGCTSAPNCIWNANGSLCNPASQGTCSGATCQYCLNFNDCASKGCTWNQTSNTCAAGQGGPGDCNSNCGDCVDPNTCFNSVANQPNRCDWNFTSYRCYPKSGGGGPCSSDCGGCNDQYSCDSSPANCMWESFNQRCSWDNGQGIDCGIYNSTICSTFANNGCQWNGTACRLSACAQNCTTCALQEPCFNSPAGCWWDFGKSACNSGGGGGGGGFIESCETGRCDLCTTQANCINTTLHPMNTNCAWGLPPFGGQAMCFMNTTCVQDCFSCHNQAECQLSNNSAFSQSGPANCSWDVYSGSCFPGSGDSSGGGDGGFGQCDQNCSLCKDPSMCDMSMAYCSWNSNTLSCARDQCAQNCTACGSSNDCFMSPMGCNWNGTACLGRSCSTDCTACSFTTDCNASAVGICVWNSTTQTCKWPAGNALSCNSDCSACTSDGQCYSSPKGCMWNYGVNTCTANQCMTNCSACDQGNCVNSFAGCFWDFGASSCKGGAGGGAGGCQTCTEDCFRCQSNSTCQTSNDSCFSQSGCTWKFDPMKQMDPWATSNYSCMPRMMGGQGGGGGFTGEPSCNFTCEFCTQSECANAHPSMAPPPGTCVWNSWDNMCHPAGGMSGSGGGMGASCFMAAGTSQSQCEAIPGCKWDPTFLKCDPNFGDFGCASTQGGMCSKCTDSTNCTSDKPHCVWDNVSTPATADDYCRDNFGGGGFKFGGNCNGMCMDCFNQQDCNQSLAGCKWLTDPFNPSMGHCDWNNTFGCPEDCFACNEQSGCQASNNTNDPFNTGATSCSWNSTFWYCKPSNYTGEICFMPGDEDNDGMEGCADPNCNNDPFCNFGGGVGGGGPGMGGPMGMNINCFQWDRSNNTWCENWTGHPEVGAGNASATGCAWHMVSKPIQFGGGMEGLCDPKFQDFVFGGMGGDAPFFIMHDQCTKDPSGGDNLNSTLWLEICDIGIKDMSNTTAFTLDLGSIADLALCNGLYLNSTNGTGKYWWFLDTDNSQSTGCSINVSGLREGGSTIADHGEGGWEYAISYVVNYTANNGTIENRIAYQCKNSTQNKWGILQATLSGKKDQACKYSGVYVGVSKSDIGNPTGTIRMSAYTGNASSQFDTSASANLVNPADRALNGYFTPGTIDFAPPNCFMNPAACGSGFDMQGGFMNFEDCFPGTGDEDFDGKKNCDDEDCAWNPFCQGQAATYNASNDTKAPTVTMNNVDTHSDHAVVHWATDEPSQGLVMFFWTNRSCENNSQNISEFNDPFFTGDDYRPFHDVPLDYNHFNPAYRLSTNMSPGVAYYYKTVSCDRAAYANGTANPNCAVSACLNFTTSRQCSSYTNQTACVTAGPCNWNNNTNVCNQGFKFGFGFTPPPFTPPTNPKGNIVFQIDLIGNRTWMTYDFSGQSYTFNGSSGVNVRFGNPNTTVNNITMPWWIYMFNCSLSSAATINMTNMFAVGNTTNNATNATLYVGLDSSKWYDLQQKLGCKKIWEQIPMLGLNCTAPMSLTYCDGNGSNCNTTLSGDNATIVECNETGNYTIWELPANSGIFSSYTLTSGVDTTAPVIYNFTIGSSTTNVSATVSWTTNEMSNSTVNYGNTTALGSTAVNSTLATSHVVYITGVTNGTTYYYQVVSSDSSGNTRTDTNAGSYYSFAPAASTSQAVTLTLGWNLISIPLTS
ncbi:MAG: fibronectin type III domain-containing protein [Candidatus Altiarchaeota archaeon]